MLVVEEVLDVPEAEQVAVGRLLGGFLVLPIPPLARATVPAARRQQEEGGQQDQGEEGREATQ